MTLKKAPIAKAIFLAAFASLALIVAYSFYESYQHACTNRGYPDDYYCTGHRFAPYALWQVVELFKELGEVIVAIATIALCFFTWSLADSTEKLWGETRDSSNIARATLDANNRPWLDFKVEPIEGLQVVNGRLSLPMRLVISNIGKCPAIAIKSGAFVPTEDDLAKPWMNILVRESHTEEMNDTAGDVAFPSGSPVIQKLKTELSIPDRALDCIVVWVGYGFSFLEQRQSVRYSAMVLHPFKREVKDNKRIKTSIGKFADGAAIERGRVLLRESRRFIS